MSNVYISAEESIDLIDNLTPAEHKLYVVLKNSVLKNPLPEYFNTENLAKMIGVGKPTLVKLQSTLRTKGYARIVKFKDETGDAMIRVIVGKDQIQLYSLGLKVEITDAKFYNEICRKYDLLNPTLSDIQRRELVDKINSEYLDQSSIIKP